LKKLTTKILEFIRDNPGAGVKDVSTYLSISMGMARTILYRLKGYGYVEKAGSGYILTSKGEWYLSKTGAEEKENKSTRLEANYSQHVEAEETPKQALPQPPQESSNASTVSIARPGDENVDERLRLIEERISRLETEIARLMDTISRIEDAVSKHSVTEQNRQPTHIEKRRPHRPKRLPVPIMTLKEAQAELGGSLDTLINNGAVIQVGRLIVDREYYERFKKKFPLSLKEAERLPPAEKRLLEELKQNAMVIWRAGKEYVFVE
jgi:hypothetical protein